MRSSLKLKIGTSFFLFFIVVLLIGTAAIYAIENILVKSNQVYSISQMIKQIDEIQKQQQQYLLNHNQRHANKVLEYLTNLQEMMTDIPLSTSLEFNQSLTRYEANFHELTMTEDRKQALKREMHIHIMKVLESLASFKGERLLMFEDIQHHMMSARLSEQEYQVSSKLENKNEAEQFIARALSQITSLKDQNKDIDLKMKIEAIQLDVQRYQTSLSKYSEVNELLLQLTIDIRLALEQLNFKSRKAMERQQTILYESKQSTYWMIFIVIIAVGLIGVILWWVVVHSIIRPLLQLEQAANTVAEGNYTISVDTKTKDELGNLSHAFNKMTNTINNYYQEMEMTVVNRTRELNEAKKHAEYLSRTDYLTGLNNRRAFIELAESALKRANRYQEKLVCLMLDIDHFKNINDSWGHHMGDKVLINVAKVIQDTLRETDIVGRIGGEEFAVILPNTEMLEARLLSQRLCEAFESSTLKYKEGEICYTASIGLAEKEQNNVILTTLLSRADEALYRAKAAGRNQVVCLEDSTQSNHPYRH